MSGISTGLRCTATGILAGVICLAGCHSAPPPYTMADFASVAKIDAHVHDNAMAPVFMEAARTDGFRLLSINVDYPDFPPMGDQEVAAERHIGSDPESFAFASTFSVREWGSEGWTAGVIAHLDSMAARGAIAVKIWKNFGMVLKDAGGAMVMLDDPRLDPVIAHIQQLSVPLISHCGEPRDCWLPVAGMMSNDMKDYFSHHPQYHMALQPAMPSYHDQISARNRTIAKHPGLTFVCAHLGSLEWNVDTLAAFLDAYPNASVDMAARMDYLQIQSQKDWQKVHDFLCRYNDRVLYATDCIVNPTDDPKVAAQAIHDKWLSDWKYLATDSVMTVRVVDGPFKGLALPRDVIGRIYRENAVRIFGRGWTPAAKARTSGGT
jgi:predicted TIM-barrel fold metal-dependent hydrolase